jgi:hypothetical protein
LSSVQDYSVTHEFVDLLAASLDPQRVLAFHFSPRHQKRLESLLEKSRQGKLSAVEAGELDEFERVEHMVRLLKARALQKQ